LSIIGKKLRKSRIFRDDGKTLIVPMENLAAWDIEESRNVDEISDWSEIAKAVIKGGADAIMTRYGIAKRYYKELVGKHVSLIVTVELESLNHVEKALRIGADAVKNAYFGSVANTPSLKVTQLADRCEQFGIPFLFETVPLSDQKIGKKPEQLFNVNSIRKAVRLGITFGADIIKTSYSGSAESFKQIVKGCSVPIVILGGPKLSNKQILERIKGAMDGGAAGVACGRNIYTHENPEIITRAISRVIHENASVEEAMKEFE
jgi:fructose-bisphosphate aldolase/2-amino-3,7-dideoxy-D-threo-hept-6-ulosonate synthase